MPPRATVIADPARSFDYRSTPRTRRPAPSVVAGALTAGMTAGFAAMIAATPVISGLTTTAPTLATVLVALWAVGWACAATRFVHGALERRRG